MPLARTEIELFVSTFRMTAEPWSARAFGVTICGSFPTVAFDPDHDRIDDPRSEVGVEVVDAPQLARLWSPASPQRRGEVRAGDGTVMATIDSDGQAGYRLWSRGVGDYVVVPDGSEVLCAPHDHDSWHWQRFLIGQVLPLASALRGVEILHASAVIMGDSAVAFVGDSCAGKTSLAVQCVLRGARWLADDVVALEVVNGGIQAHPGAPIAGVRHSEVDGLTPAERTRLGRPIAENAKEVIFRLRGCGEAWPLHGLYLLDRHPKHAEVSFTRVTDPRFLLSSTFNFLHRPPERLAALLEICSVMDCASPTFRVSVPTTVTARELAEAVDRHRCSPQT